MTCRAQANIIDLGARQRIRKLFGPKVTISDAPLPAVQVPLGSARPIDDGGKGDKPAPFDARPCDTEPAA